MLMSDGPWSPEHIYQEIVGYGKTWHRGEHELFQIFMLLIQQNLKSKGDCAGKFFLYSISYFLLGCGIGIGIGTGIGIGIGPKKPVKTDPGIQNS